MRKRNQRVAKGVLPSQSFRCKGFVVKCIMSLKILVLCSKLNNGNMKIDNKVLCMSSDRFLLAVESRDLSQADKSLIRVLFSESCF